MSKERYASLSEEHRAIIDQLAGLPIRLKLAQSFDGADVRSNEMIAEADKDYEWIVLPDEERSKMEAAVAESLEAIFSDYESRGVSNGREIYEALNR